MKFKLFGLNWDLTPVALMLFCVWCGWCMFGGMAGGKDAPAWIISVVITLALTPQFDKWFKTDD